MLFEETYRFVFIIYAIFGLSPFKLVYHDFSKKRVPLSRNKRSKWIICIMDYAWTPCLSILELCSVFCASIAHVNVLLSVEIDVFIASAYVIQTTIHLLYILNSIEWVFKRNFEMKILKRLHEIDTIFAENFCFQMNYHRLRNSIRNTFLLWVVFILIVFKTYIFHWNFASFIQCDVLAIKLILNGSRYTTYAILLRHRIEALTEILDQSRFQIVQSRSAFESSSRQQSNINHSPEALRNTETERERMMNLQRVFNKLHDSIGLVNDNFKWSISLNISNDIFSLSLNLFCILRRFLDPVYAQKYRTSLEIFFTARSFNLGYFIYHVIILINVANNIAECGRKLTAKSHQVGLSVMVSDELRDFVSIFLKGNEISENFEGANLSTENSWRKPPGKFCSL